MKRISSSPVPDATKDETNKNNVESVLQLYEELWRGAALADRVQFHSGDPKENTGTTGYSTCAWLIAPSYRHTRAVTSPLDWICPLCQIHEPAINLVMVHLNNHHRWTWDMFAHKFRDILKEGTR